MILFIPLSVGQSIPKQVYDSLAHQTIDINIVPCITSGIFNSNKNPIKIKYECNSRNLAIEITNTYYTQDKYIAMQDRDLIHLDNSNYDRCIKFLDTNSNINAVSIPWKEYEIKDHIRLTGTVFRTEIFKNLTFKYNIKNHICLSLMKDLGDSYIFLPSNKRLIKEINV